MTTRLDDFDFIEWFDICRVLRADLTVEEFDEMWAEFEELKRMRELH